MTGALGNRFIREGRKGISKTCWRAFASIRFEVEPLPDCEWLANHGRSTSRFARIPTRNWRSKVRLESTPVIENFEPNFRKGWICDDPLWDGETKKRTFVV